MKLVWLKLCTWRPRKGRFLNRRVLFNCLWTTLTLMKATLRTDRYALLPRVGLRLHDQEDQAESNAGAEHTG